MSTWNRTGTIAVTNGSATVTGTGVDWSDVSEGDALHAPDGEVYEIASVTGSTLTLVDDYVGSTEADQEYSIQPTRGVVASLRNRVRELIESAETLLEDYDLPLAVAKGGTGAQDVATAQANLELVPIASMFDTTPARLLRPGAGGLLINGATTDAQLPPANDLNALRISGLWRYDGSTTGKPAPSAGVVQHLVRIAGDGTARHFQLHFGLAGATPVGVRRMLSDGNWSVWYQLWTGENAVGTVSQSGGVPTGALFQYGSNSNGEFLRLADGTQYCWHSLNSGTGGNTFWTYPASFTGAVRGSATPVVDGAARMAGFSAIGSSSLGFSVWNIAGARVAAATSLFAIGRWY